MTQADKIRAMTDEEMARMLDPTQPIPLNEEYCDFVRDGLNPGFCDDNCKDCILDWLKQEIPAPPQKDPLCDTCKHAIDGVVDDFAAVFCAARCGYFGQVTECEKYERK